MHKRRGMRKTQWTTTGNWAIKEHLFYLKIHKITFFYKKKNVQKLLNAPKRFWIEIWFFSSLFHKIDEEEGKNLPQLIKLSYDARIVTKGFVLLWLQECDTLQYPWNQITHIKNAFFLLLFLVGRERAYYTDTIYTPRMYCTSYSCHVVCCTPFARNSFNLFVFETKWFENAR